MKLFKWHGIAIATAILLVVSCPAPRPQPAGSAPERAVTAGAPEFDKAFWMHWGDGKAEIAAYDLKYPRYGQIRSGVAVTIFVTETFSESARVKADPGKHPPADEFPVMKHNLLRDFQTGIYDYNTMLSSFVALKPLNGRPAGAATKLTFSAQEWCGHAWQQVLFDAKSARFTLHSYFDGEADQQRQIEYPPDGITEDSLFLWVRGMAWPALSPAESRNAPALFSMQTARDTHGPLEWNPTMLTRTVIPQTITVPAGTFETELWAAQQEGGILRRYFVEKAFPHRIIRWEFSTGEKAELLGVDRLEYWKMNGEGAEAALKKLGLAPRPPRTT